MAQTKEEKAEILQKFRVSPNDTASPQVQVALLTQRLKALNEHFQVNKKDRHSRYGLLKLVGQRRRLLRYLRNKDETAYKTLIQELEIRK